MQNRGMADLPPPPGPMLFAKLCIFINTLCIPRIQNLVTAKLWCRISYQNTKFIIQITVSISIKVFDCYTKFIVTLQLTIWLGSTFKHQKVLLYNGRYVPIFWRNVLPSSSINIYSDGGGSFFRNVRTHVPNYKAFFVLIQSICTLEISVKHNN